MAKRKGFTSIEKFGAALSVIKGEKSQVEVGRELNCHPTLVYGWQKSIETGGSVVFDKALEEGVKDKRIAELEQYVGRLTTQNDFLGRVLGRSTGA
jgi:transposase-like protein